MATFYRIEHKESLIGPYNHFSEEESTYFVALISQHNMSVSVSSKSCPTPYGKFCDSVFTSGARFGFSSVSKARKWFGRSKKKYALFEKYGFVLRKYDVTMRFDSAEQSIAHACNMLGFEDLPFSTLTK